MMEPSTGPQDLEMASSDDLHMIKCVVVGDTGVGKTRLICSRVCGARYTLPQLMQTHVPTVWAIDQYRKNPQTLRNSWFVVDGVTVSLRLWDTFGDHSKDRRFAYGRADVVLVCFSVVQQRSLRNVTSHWHQEIQRQCPGVPVILCGCQVDLRYLYKDPEFMKMEKGLFFREITDKDILLPEKGREMAKNLGASYYETSVYEPFGVETVFTNAARAALIYKRERHFWKALGTLKYISSPHFQSPHQPPKPAPPVAMSLQTSRPNVALGNILDSEMFCDVEFLVQNVLIRAHRTILVASSSMFERLFLSERVPVVSDSLRTSKSSAFGEFSLSETSFETTSLLEETDSGANLQESKCSSSQEISSNHEQQFCQLFTNVNIKDEVSVVTVSNLVAPDIFRALLRFLYVGECSVESALQPDLCWLSEAIGLNELLEVVSNITNHQDYMNQSAVSEFLKQRNERLKTMIIGESLFSDVIFELDDGIVRAHRALLAWRSDVMFSMFSYGFKEKSSKLVTFPGVTVKVFTTLLEFLYTGSPPVFHLVDSLAMIELANRLCQPELLSLTENNLVVELTALDQCGHDITDDVLVILEQSELHNAKYLHEWCLWYLRVNYDAVYSHHSKLLRSLPPTIQIYLTNQRWPPVWYRRELDIYEKNVLDLYRKRTVRSCLPLSGRCSCLSCFSVRKDDRNQRLSSPIIRVNDP